MEWTFDARVVVEKIYDWEDPLVWDTKNDILVLKHSCSF